MMILVILLEFMMTQVARVRARSCLWARVMG